MKQLPIMSLTKYKGFFCILFSLLFVMHLSMAQIDTCVATNIPSCGLMEDFSNFQIDSSWCIVNKNPDSEFIPGSGTLRIKASPRNGGSDLFHTSNNYKAPRLLRPAIGDWLAEAKLFLQPDSMFQAAGFVVVLEDDVQSDSVQRFNEYGFHGPPPAEPIRKILFPAENITAYYPFDHDVVYLRLLKEGELYSTWHSEDGNNWVSTGSRIMTDSIYYVGITSLRQAWDGDSTLYTNAIYDYVYFSCIDDCTSLVASTTSTPASNGFANGTATVTPSGGTPGYQYYWDSAPPQFDATATGLAPGLYTVTVTDTLACTYATTVMVEETTEIDCEEEVSLEPWSEQGQNNFGAWPLFLGDTKVRQILNGEPTFYINPTPFSDAEFEWTMYMNSESDDDFAGFVFGYQDPIGADGEFDFWLFDWKRGQQSYEGYFADEGMTLSRLNLSLADPTDANAYIPYFWGHSTGTGELEVLGTNYGADLGWEYDTTYNMKLIYTPSEVTIFVGDEEVFNISGDFPSGKFGFYNYSQKNVDYGNVFICENLNVEICNDNIDNDNDGDIDEEDSECPGVDPCTIFPGSSRTITYVEYFFNIDPGFGNGIAVPIGATETICANFMADLSNVPVGINTLYVRAQDCLGDWSLLQKHSFLNSAEGCPSDSIKIIKVEYFFDADPGFGNGTDIPVNAQEELTTTFVANTNGLSPGIHVLYVRAKDCNGNWSMLQQKQFFHSAGDCTHSNNEIVQMEYFIDDDPGFGNATVISFNPAGNVNHSFTIDLSNISHGLHTIYVRAKDCMGLWNQVQKKTIFVSPDTNGNNEIVRLEYFWNTDPGFGNANPVTDFNPEDTLIHTFSVDMNTLDTGTHIFYVRAIDTHGDWSLLSRDTVMNTEVGDCQGFEASVSAIPDTASMCIGSATVSPTGGTSPYTYQWDTNPVQTTATATGLCEGTYTVIVTDSMACTLTRVVPIGNIPGLCESFVLDSISITDVICESDSTGTISISPMGGQEPYTYFINGSPLSGPTATDLPIGDYYIEVFDVNGCSASDSLVIGFQFMLPEAAFVYEITGLSVSFNDTIESGTSSWNFGDGNISNLTDPMHTYSEAIIYEACLTVSNICGSTTICQTIDLTVPLSAEISETTNPTCFDSCDGSIELSVSSGIMPYQFDWSVAGLSGQNPTDLCPGEYFVTVSDQGGDSIVLTTILTAPDSLFFTVEIMNATCGNSLDGSITINPTGGTAPYSYELSGMLSTDSIFSGLGAQTYEIVVTDNNACTQSGMVTLGFDIDLPVANFEADTSGTSLTFTDLSSGDPLTWFWTFGDGNDSDEANPIHNYDSTGIYEVCLTVTNECGANTYCDSVEVDVSVSIADIILQHSNLYPNPTTGKATLTFHLAESEVVSLWILDALNTIVAMPLQKQRLPTGEQQVKFDLHDLPVGIYLLVLDVDGIAPFSWKLVVMRE